MQFNYIFGRIDDRLADLLVCVGITSRALDSRDVTIRRTITVGRDHVVRWLKRLNAF